MSTEQTDNSNDIEVLQNIIIRKEDSSVKHVDALSSVDPISPAHAIPQAGECMVSDDDDQPKVILELETVPIEEHEDIEDSITTVVHIPKDSGHASELAKQQLKALSCSKRKGKHSYTEALPKTTPIASDSNETQNASKETIVEDVEKQHLIDILEGNMDDENDDNVELEVIPVTENGEPADEESLRLLSQKDEQQIALEQMMSIKSRKRGRKPIDKSGTATGLVQKLVMDWSDDEKDEDSKLSTVRGKIVKTGPPTAKKGQPSPVPIFKSTRVVKKKIIWDPDAPETKISYASLVQSSSAKKSTPNKRNIVLPKKLEVKPVAKATPKNESPEHKGRLLNSMKRRSETPPALNHKKKKISEIDRLLRDEGAANMLNSIENDKSTPKEVRAKREPATNDKSVKKDHTPRKRGPKSASASWDYVYNQQNVDSLIIRRRSNSSYSSTSPRRLSLDTTPTQQQPKKPGTRGKNFEFAKPGTKKVSPSDESKNNTNATLMADIKTRDSNRKSQRSSVNDRNNSHLDLSPAAASVDLGKDLGGDVVVKKLAGNVVQLILKPKTDDVKNSFTPALMNNVVSALEKLQNDSSCKVVCVTSQGMNFCEGVDFSGIVQANSLEKRKNAVSELAMSVRQFLQNFLSFPKPLVAAVNGICSGLGVTMLPLFDVVIGSDKATFNTPYARIGQLPEGNCIFTLNHSIRHTFKTKLLLLGETMNATEATLGGLITKVVSMTKVQEEALQYARKLALLPTQGLRSMKQQKQNKESSELTTSLLEEQKIMSQHWISNECQEKFKQYLANGSW